MKQLILVSTLILTLVACKKDKTNIGAGASPRSQITITGITPLDINGTQLGSADTTDWTKDTNWTNSIFNLFSFTDTINYSTAEIANIVMHPNYPNPVDSISVFNFQTDKATVLKCVIVDEQLNVLNKTTTFLSASGIYNFILSFSNNALYQHGKYYRLYYTFYDHNKTPYYRGHGDVKLN